MNELVCDTRSSDLEYEILDINRKMKLKSSQYTPRRHKSFRTLVLCGGQRSTSTQAALLQGQNPSAL
jgi:hypothetical protein